MRTLKYAAFLLTFITFNTAQADENKMRATVDNERPQPLQRRYSEAILASDYSRSVDNMLKKNFVDWLLARREKKSDNTSEATKREADFQLPDGDMKEKEAQEGFERNVNYFTGLMRNKHRESVYNEAKMMLNQQLVDLLMLTDLCKQRFS
ncbi:gastric inhibitory polypeptide S homeolog precursor [Xenopus laevis]|uniref:Gastric inhibitory polypeptide n=2 Tax=Xenopus laevis TaxID=8355 RepID=A1DPK2_XENLA|nr:gastric inhibitory polypeptide S homeolog precursor [Xenopus laevis]AAI69550.1 Glucose-dependent insulinotropic polypeptide [Xenopus laevis]AAI69578.1 Glucose-dependent insulinotropic polypeptide [Xenopus laevis]ABL10368.1 glucose-dependent insulinotropic polypeptide [Xenopus laevis]OCT59977.1 hypothetical protein XELAEV_18045996mg [Xenopus laevis]